MKRSQSEGAPGRVVKREVIEDKENVRPSATKAEVGGQSCGGSNLKKGQDLLSKDSLVNPTLNRLKSLP